MSFAWPLVRKKTEKKAREVYEGTRGFPLLFDSSLPEEADFTARTIVYTLLYQPYLVAWYFRGSQVLERMSRAVYDMAQNPDETERILSEVVEEFYRDYRAYKQQS